MSEKDRLKLYLNQAEKTVAILKSRIADLEQQEREQNGDNVKIVKFGDLKPGQKFKATWPGASNVMIKCYTVPGTNITEYTPDFLGWAVNLSDGQLNEWEKSGYVCLVE